MESIVNKVAKSPLITVNLEDFYPKGNRLVLDIAPWLCEGLILKEKDFRAFVAQHPWQQYADSYVAITCSADAIIPSWAYLLVSSHLVNYAKKIVVGDLNLLETVLFSELINTLDLTSYQNKPVIIKGCAKKPIPNSAFSLLVQKLQPLVKSLMYGEACSNVPLFKKDSQTF